MDDAEKFSLTIRLIRVMFPFLLFISIAALAMGILNSLRSFFLPALAPAFFNLALIASALFIAPQFHVPIIALGIGVTCGGAIQYGVQLIGLVKKDFSIRPIFSFSHPGLRKILVLVLPVVAAIGATQINVMVSNIFATFLPEGSASYLYYGMRLVLFPVGIFGVAMATAVLPSMSEQAAKGDLNALRDTFSFSLRLVFFMSIPAMVGLIVLSAPIINLLYQRGEFTAEAAQGTVSALLFYSAGLWAFVGSKVVRTPFYSMKDTKTPLKVAIISVVINTVFCFILQGPLKHGGLALALSLSASVNFILLFILLRKRFGRVDGRNIARNFAKITFASLIMGMIGWFMSKGTIWSESGRSLEKAVILSAVIVLCASVYFLIMYFMKSEELSFIMKIRKKKR
jgi:putative peptidoglycan lipid II flippase